VMMASSPRGLTQVTAPLTHRVAPAVLQMSPGPPREDAAQEPLVDLAVVVVVDPVDRSGTGMLSMPPEAVIVDAVADLGLAGIDVGVTLVASRRRYCRRRCRPEQVT